MMNKGKILIIDDDETIIHFLKKLFISEGYEVFSANGGDEGLVQIEKVKPNLIFLDIFMSEISGLDVLRKIFPLSDKNYSVVVISGYDNKDIIAQCFNMGVYFFLAKPFEINNILNLTKQIINEQNYKSQLEIIFSNLIDGLLLVDTHSDIVIKVNSSFLDMFGMTEEEVLGKSIENLLVDEDAEIYMNKTGVKLQVGKEIPYIRNDGSYIIAENNVTAVDIGNYQYLLISIKDITETKHGEKEIREKNDMMLFQARQAQMGELLSMIVHQWKQPLSAISASAGLIELMKRMDNINPAQLDKSLKNITKSVKFMAETIDDFRNFFKKEKNKSLFDIKSLIDKTIFFISDGIKNNEIQVNFDNQIKDKINIIGNEIRQVFLNIFANAVDALSELNLENREINILLTEDENFQKIEISNNGGNIPEGIIEKVFNSYFTTKGEKKGTGIGLYMSRMIVEKNHNGKIYVENIEGGVKFTILLPKC